MNRSQTQPLTVKLIESFLKLSFNKEHLSDFFIEYTYKDRIKVVDIKSDYCLGVFNTINGIGYFNNLPKIIMKYEKEALEKFFKSSDSDFLLLNIDENLTEDEKKTKYALRRIICSSHNFLEAFPSAKEKLFDYYKDSSFFYARCYHVKHFELIKSDIITTKDDFYRPLYVLKNFIKLLNDNRRYIFEEIDEYPFSDDKKKKMFESNRSNLLNFVKGSDFFNINPIVTNTAIHLLSENFTKKELKENNWKLDDKTPVYSIGKKIILQSLFCAQIQSKNISSIEIKHKIEPKEWIYFGIIDFRKLKGPNMDNENTVKNKKIIKIIEHNINNLHDDTVTPEGNIANSFFPNQMINFFSKDSPLLSKSEDNCQYLLNLLQKQKIDIYKISTNKNGIQSSGFTNLFISKFDKALNYNDMKSKLFSKEYNDAPESNKNIISNYFEDNCYHYMKLFLDELGIQRVSLMPTMYSLPLDFIKNEYIVNRSEVIEKCLLHYINIFKDSPHTNIGVMREYINFMDKVKVRKEIEDSLKNINVDSFENKETLKFKI